MMKKKGLIVNADDFGQSPGVNEGVIEAHERGIVTSASLMVRWPSAATAAAYAREHPRLDLGLHVDLGEWSYRDGAWVPRYGGVALDDAAAVSEEASRQLAAFHALVGRAPTHLDSHQHVHRREPVRSVLISMARLLALPLRHHTPAIRYCGEFYGQTAEGEPLAEQISVRALIKILTALPDGVTELCCHPARQPDFETTYRDERVRETRVLCDPRIPTALETLGIERCSFADVTEISVR